MREALKTLARGIALIVMLPALASYGIRSLLLGRHRALEGSTQMLSLLPGVAGQYLRGAFLGRVIARCAPSATVSFGTILSRADARIDDHAYVGPGCFLGRVQIGRDVLIGSGVHITSGARTHGIDNPNLPIRAQGGERSLVTIGPGAWIGSGAIVMADVGANSIVGAGAVVTKPIPPDVLAAGVPAAVIRTRS
jgi:acetyltransferase-like isoleucine patch superfamily enzyme